MAKNFTLNPINPAAKSGPKNTIYTGLKEGNLVNLVIANNTGFPLTIGGQSTGKILSLKIPKTVMDAANAAKLKVATPWKKVGFDLPKMDPQAEDNKDYFVFKLQPPAAGVPLDPGKSITINLSSFLPTKKGNATIFTEYEFAPGTTMSPAGQLVVIGQNNPDKATLIGENDALKFSFRINDGLPNTNSIIVSNPPVTAATGAENTIALTLDFQDHLIPDKKNADHLGRLVEKWDPSNPPTFRIQFPYFSSLSNFPSPIDLTDDIKPGDPNYNEFTSAWKIKLSLDADNPNTQNNDWWTITFNLDADTPHWLVQPTPLNKYLFTGGTSGPNEPGQFLNLFFTHIYTDLKRDDSSPQTLMYLQTYDFPTFNDDVESYMMNKSALIEIDTFSGVVNYNAAGEAQLELSWTAKHADKFFVLGSGNSQPQVSPFKQTINLQNRLASSYTLKATGASGKPITTKTIYARWKEDLTNVSEKIYGPSGLAVTVDGKTVFVCGAKTDGGNAQLFSLNSHNLVTENELSLPNSDAALNVATSPNGSYVYIAGAPADKSTGRLYQYTTNLQQAPLATVTPGYSDTNNLYSIAISEADGQVILSAAFANTAPFMAAYSQASLATSTGSPATVKHLGPIGLDVEGDLIFYPLTQGGLGTMDRRNLKALSSNSLNLGSTSAFKYTPGPIAISPDHKTVATLALHVGVNPQGDLDYTGVLCVLDIVKFKVIFRGEASTYLPQFPAVNMFYSLDGKYLFVQGLKGPITTQIDNAKTEITVYDTTNYQPVPMQSSENPTVPITKIYWNTVMAPDGSRIYGTTVNSNSDHSGQVVELKVGSYSVKDKS